MTTTAARPTTPPVQTKPFTTWTPEPLPLSTRESVLLTLAREAYDRNPDASSITLSTEAMHAIWVHLDRLERERDRQGDHAIEWRTRSNRLEGQFNEMMERYGKLVTWAAKRLRCAANLAEILKKIGG